MGIAAPSQIRFDGNKVYVTTSGGYTTEHTLEQYNAAKDIADGVGQRSTAAGLQWTPATYNNTLIANIRDSDQQNQGYAAQDSYVSSQKGGGFSRFLKGAAPIAAIAAAALGAPMLSSAITGGTTGAGIGASLAGAGYSSANAAALGGFAGSGIASATGAGALSGLGAAIGSNLTSVGSGASLAGSFLKGAKDINSVLSAVKGAQDLFGGGQKQSSYAATQPSAATAAPTAEAPPFSPVRPSQMNQPESLGAEFSTFSPEQQRSALATRGLNQGLGSEEDSYYRNLVQRSLIGDGNRVQQQSSDQFLLPVESQYFSRRGANTSDIMQFLQDISG